MNNKFDDGMTATIGVEFSSKYIRTADDKATVRVQLWDTVGDERFKSVSNIYMRNAVGALLCYDVTSTKSFASLKTWIEKLRSVADTDIVVLCVGNKTDLTD
jgi:small GTP-binding protein